MPLTAEEVQKAMRVGKSPRAQRIEDYQRYFDGTFYDDRQDFFADVETPLRERRPCVQYHVVRNAAKSYTAMCLGDGKFPAITSGTSEDDSAFDPRFGLSESESGDLDAGIRKIKEQTRLDAVSQELLETALSSGTTVPIVSVVKGRLRVSQIDPKCCTPTFRADDPEEVESLEVSYRFVTDDTWSDSDRKFVKRVWQYRRVIDATFDTVFQPVEIQKVDDRPIPTSEKTKYKHGFGFCPVVWFRFNAPVADIADIDGKPIHWGLTSLIDAINLSLSQRFRAALYLGDPQICEFGVLDDEFRAPMGRAADPRQPGNDPSGWREPLNAKRGGGMKKRQKGAGTVWRFESPDARVEILALAKGALDAIADDAADNIKKLRETLGNVYIDPADLAGSGSISGKTLAFLFATQIARCDRIREEFGRRCLLPVLNMLFRVVLKSGKGLYLAGAQKLAAVLAKFEARVGDDNGATWFEPSLRLAWGDYFPTSDMDDAARVQSTILALTNPRPIITLATAVNAIKALYPDIQDAEQYILKLVAEAKDRQASLVANAQAMAATGGLPSAAADNNPSASPGGDATSGASSPAKSPPPPVKKPTAQEAA